MVLQYDLSTSTTAVKASSNIASRRRGRPCYGVRRATSAQRERDVLGEIERIYEHALLEQEADPLRLRHRRVK